MRGLKNITAYVEGRGLVRASIGFENGKIAYIGECGDKIESIFDGEGVALPGFIDEHVHGAGGADTMDATADALATISDFLAMEGTTAFLATTMTQSRENISRALVNVREALECFSCRGAELLGVHLEGPFISDSFVGAQPPEYVTKPDIALFDEYNALSGESIKIVTVAPETDGAPELIAHLRERGIIASIGHSGAAFRDVERAVALGASGVTHTYNAQSGLHHREIGVAGSALLFDELCCEAICDTIHISIPAIRLLIKNKPHDKLVLITDAMRAKGMADGVSELGGQRVFVKNGEARLADGALAGSVLRMNTALKNLVTLAGVDFLDAVDFATANPAKNLGLYGERGSIALGKRADITVLDKDYEVLLTVVGGEVKYRKNRS